MSKDYDEYADRQNAEYRKAYAAWIASQSEKGLATLAALGVTAASVDPKQANDNDDDAALSSIASEPAPLYCDPLADRICDLFAVTPAQGKAIAGWFLAELDTAASKHKAFIIARVVGGLMRPGNVRLRCVGLAFAAGLDQLNDLGSQTEAGRLLGVSRAAVSKVVNEWSDLLELPRTRHMKTAAARKSYSEDKKANHWRKKKCTAKK